MTANLSTMNLSRALVRIWISILLVKYPQVTKSQHYDYPLLDEDDLEDESRAGEDEEYVEDTFSYDEDESLRDIPIDFNYGKELWPSYGENWRHVTYPTDFKTTTSSMPSTSDSHSDKALNILRLCKKKFADRIDPHKLTYTRKTDSTVKPDDRGHTIHTYSTNSNRFGPSSHVRSASVPTKRITIGRNEYVDCTKLLHNTNSLLHPTTNLEYFAFPNVHQVTYPKTHYMQTHDDELYAVPNPHDIKSHLRKPVDNSPAYATTPYYHKDNHYFLVTGSSKLKDSYTTKHSISVKSIPTKTASIRMHEYISQFVPTSHLIHTNTKSARRTSYSIPSSQSANRSSPKLSTSYASYTPARTSSNARFTNKISKFSHVYTKPTENLMSSYTKAKIRNAYVSAYTKPLHKVLYMSSSYTRSTHKPPYPPVYTKPTRKAHYLTTSYAKSTRSSTYSTNVYTRLSTSKDLYLTSSFTRSLPKNYLTFDYTRPTYLNSYLMTAFTRPTHKAYYSMYTKQAERTRIFSVYPRSKEYYSNSSYTRSTYRTPYLTTSYTRPIHRVSYLTSTYPRPILRTRFTSTVYPRSTYKASNLSTSYVMPNPKTVYLSSVPQTRKYPYLTSSSSTSTQKNYTTFLYLNTSHRRLTYRTPYRTTAFTRPPNKVDASYSSQTLGSPNSSPVYPIPSYESSLTSTYTSSKINTPHLTTVYKPSYPTSVYTRPTHKNSYASYRISTHRTPNLSSAYPRPTHIASYLVSSYTRLKNNTHHGTTAYKTAYTTTANTIPTQKVSYASYTRPIHGTPISSSGYPRTTHQSSYLTFSYTRSEYNMPHSKTAYYTKPIHKVSYGSYTRPTHTTPNPSSDYPRPTHKAPYMISSYTKSTNRTLYLTASSSNHSFLKGHYLTHSTTKSTHTTPSSTNVDAKPTSRYPYSNYVKSTYRTPYLTAVHSKPLDISRYLISNYTKSPYKTNGYTKTTHKVPYLISSYLSSTHKSPYLTFEQTELKPKSSYFTSTYSNLFPFITSYISNARTKTQSVTFAYTTPTRRTSKLNHLTTSPYFRFIDHSVPSAKGLTHKASYVSETSVVTPKFQNTYTPLSSYKPTDQIYLISTQDKSPSSTKSYYQKVQGRSSHFPTSYSISLSTYSYKQNGAYKKLPKALLTNYQSTQTLFPTRSSFHLNGNHKQSKVSYQENSQYVTNPSIATAIYNPFSVHVPARICVHYHHQSSYEDMPSTSHPLLFSASNENHAQKVEEEINRKISLSSQVPYFTQNLENGRPSDNNKLPYHRSTQPVTLATSHPSYFEKFSQYAAELQPILPTAKSKMHDPTDIYTPPPYHSSTALRMQNKPSIISKFPSTPTGHLSTVKNLPQTPEKVKYVSAYDISSLHSKFKQAVTPVYKFSRSNMTLFRSPYLEYPLQTRHYPYYTTKYSSTYTKKPQSNYYDTTKVNSITTKVNSITTKVNSITTKVNSFTTKVNSTKLKKSTQSFLDNNNRSKWINQHLPSYQYQTTSRLFGDYQSQYADKYYLHSSSFSDAPIVFHSIREPNSTPLPNKYELYYKPTTQVSKAKVPDHNVPTSQSSKPKYHTYSNPSQRFSQYAFSYGSSVKNLASDYKLNETLKISTVTYNPLASVPDRHVILSEDYRRIQAVMSTEQSDLTSNLGNHQSKNFNRERIASVPFKSGNNRKILTPVREIAIPMFLKLPPGYNVNERNNHSRERQSRRKYKNLSLATTRQPFYHDSSPRKPQVFKFPRTFTVSSNQNSSVTTLLLKSPNRKIQTERSPPANYSSRNRQSGGRILNLNFTYSRLHYNNNRNLENRKPMVFTYPFYSTTPILPTNLQIPLEKIIETIDLKINQSGKENINPSSATTKSRFYIYDNLRNPEPKDTKIAPYQNTTNLLLKIPPITIPSESDTFPKNISIRNSQPVQEGINERGSMHQKYITDRSTSDIYENLKKQQQRTLNVSAYPHPSTPTLSEIPSMKRIPIGIYSFRRNMESSPITPDRERRNFTSLVPSYSRYGNPKSFQPKISPVSTYHVGRSGNQSRIIAPVREIPLHVGLKTPKRSNVGIPLARYDGHQRVQSGRWNGFQSNNRRYRFRGPYRTPRPISYVGGSVPYHKTT